MFAVWIHYVMSMCVCVYVLCVYVYVPVCLYVYVSWAQKSHAALTPRNCRGDSEEGVRWESAGGEEGEWEERGRGRGRYSNSLLYVSFVICWTTDFPVSVGVYIRYHQVVWKFLVPLALCRYCCSLILYLSSSYNQLCCLSHKYRTLSSHVPPTPESHNTELDIPVRLLLSLNSHVSIAVMTYSPLCSCQLSWSIYYDSFSGLPQKFPLLLHMLLSYSLIPAMNMNWWVYIIST